MNDREIFEKWKQIMGDPRNDDRMAEYRRGIQLQEWKESLRNDPDVKFHKHYLGLSNEVCHSTTEALALMREIDDFLREHGDREMQQNGPGKIWRLWYHAGSECQKNGLLDEAMQCYEKGLDYKYINGDVRGDAEKEYQAFKEMLGMERRARGKIDNAEGVDKAKAYVEHAWLNNTSRDVALADMEAAAKLDDSLVDVLFYKAVKFQFQRRYEEAVEYFMRILERCPEIDCYYRRGECFMALGLTERAAADFTTVIEHSPKDYDAYSRRAAAYKKLGWQREAAKDEAAHDKLYEEASYIPGGQIDIGNYSSHLYCNGHNYQRIFE